MNSIKHYFSFFLVVSLIMGITMSCGNRPKNVSTEETEAVTVVEIDELLANAGAYSEKTVQIEGVCMHICQHGGTKIFLMGSDESNIIRVQAGEKLGSFVPETVNNIVKVTGILKVVQAAEVHDHSGHDHSHEAGEVCEAEQMASGKVLSCYIESDEYSIVVDEN